MSEEDKHIRQMTNEKRFEHLDKELGTLGTKVAGLEAGQHALASAFQTFQGGIGRRFDQMADYIRENKPKGVNLLGLGSLLVALGAATTGYMTTRLRPTEKTVDRLVQIEQAHLVWQREHATDVGRMHATVQENADELDTLWGQRFVDMETVGRLKERTEQLQRMEERNESARTKFLEAMGRLQALERKVQRIDEGGSIRWNAGAGAPRASP